MNRTTSRAAIGAVLSVLISCVVRADAPPTTRAATHEHGARIAIANFTFEPSTLTVSAGTELTWLNHDDVPHTVIGADPGSPIKSPPLDTDDRYSIRLTKPGTYRYFCSLHPHMTGTIVVE